MGAPRGSVVGLTVLGLGGCAPKVDPRSPFDEDDPRALREDRERAAANASAGGGHAADAPAAPVPIDPEEAAVPLVPPGTGVRAGMIARAELRPMLDAGPAAFLAWFDTDAATVDGRFVGWRLVRIRPAGRALTALDLMAGDVLVAVNGHPLRRPDELGDLWAELYGAGAIVAEVNRGGDRFTLRFTIAGEPLPAPTRPTP